MEMILVTVTAVIALLFALFTAKKLAKSDAGTEDVRRISGIIRKAANAFLKRQYTVVAIFFAVIFVLLLILAAFGAGNWFTPFAFLTGGIFSGLAGFIGMRIATSSNGRTVMGCKQSLNKGLRTAFSSGTVMGMVVVGLGLLDTSLWYLGLKHIAHMDPSQIANTMVCFGIGASSMALFARVGGGIFTKAADVGADLCGKVEAGIPEDDIRNPAVIADNVGDNVGDVAGMGADLYESYVGSVLSASALGVFAGLEEMGFIVPFLIAVAGVIASIIGTFFVRTGENATQKQLLASLRKGTYISTLIMVVAAGAIIYFMLSGKEGINIWGLYGSVLCGLIAGVAMGAVTEYFTSDTYKPTQKLAKASDTGSATVIIDGLALGMRSTMLSIIIVVAAIAGSFFLAGGTIKDPGIGLFGVGIAAVGMLSTLGITLATDAYGPVADNAGGIAEMTGQEPYVRERTDALDSLGNTTAATGKGFAIGSAALTAITLIAAFKSTVEGLGYTFNLNILNPQVLIGFFIGVMLTFLFSAVTMQAVGRAAGRIVTEVRRQFREIKGIMTGEAQPDYEACVDICTRSSQQEMILPAVIAVVAPILVGILLEFNGIAGMLAGAAASGFCMATMMSNSGGAWDNAKKYIESGAIGGKGSDNHKAAVVGDTVGDPFKDTSGPSINILIKLLSVVSIVFAPIILVIIKAIWGI
ncbi:MAG: sodium-translocating pyrophosphatase [Clostridia bacterium]|nr:sodium-translocating pyrophosphatase [Clostridia bacterium]